MEQHNIIDGFTYSLNRLLLPINYAVAALAQMETLRLASGYQFKAYVVPQPENPFGSSGETNYVPAYGQTEQQIRIDPGSYLYGWAFYAGSSDNTGLFHILVTDQCTETPLSSDYILASLLDISSPFTTTIHAPCLLAQPRLISDPGLVNVEIYNNSSEPIPGQLVLYTAAPRPLPPPNTLVGSNPGWHAGAGKGPQY